MPQQIWINLPVKNVAESVVFFTALGFELNPMHAGNPDMACLLVGQHKIAVMLFAEHLFQQFIQHPISNTSQGTEMLLSIDAASSDEVDTLIQKVAAAGGTVYARPGYKDGWMYGAGFIDPNGHRWNILYMDMSKVPAS